MVRRGGGRGPLGAVFVTVIEGQRLGGEGRGGDRRDAVEMRVSVVVL